MEKTVELMQDEYLARMSHEQFDNNKWEKQMLKLYKAMMMMEQFKSEPPFFSLKIAKLA